MPREYKQMCLPKKHPNHPAAAKTFIGEVKEQLARFVITINTPIQFSPILSAEKTPHCLIHGFHFWEEPFVWNEDKSEVIGIPSIGSILVGKMKRW